MHEHVDSSPPQLTEEKEIAELLLKSIRLDATIRQHHQAMRLSGPEDLVSFYYRLLQFDGFAEIEETPAISQFTKYIWHTVDRYNQHEVTWEFFQDEVERWYLLMVGKLESWNGPKKALAHG